MPGEGQERDLPVHVRRAQPRRHVRLQARSSTRSTARRSRSRRSAGAARRTRAGSSARSGRSSQYGECGKWVSDLFPNLGTCVDDIAFIHSMYAESPIHGSAMLMMNSGRHPERPSRAWARGSTYGLGSENENLPGFVVMLDQTGGPISGAKNWSSGYMPAAYPGDGAPRQRHADPRPGLAAGHRRGPTQRLLLDRLREKNEEHLAPAPTTPSWPRGSPATSWPSRCKLAPPRRSTSPANRPRRRHSTGSTSRGRPTSAASA